MPGEGEETLLCAKSLYGKRSAKVDTRQNALLAVSIARTAFFFMAAFPESYPLSVPSSSAAMTSFIKSIVVPPSL